MDNSRLVSKRKESLGYLHAFLGWVLPFSETPKASGRDLRYPSLHSYQGELIIFVQIGTLLRAEGGVVNYWAGTVCLKTKPS